eukprot:Skav219884  [mRNA]  locus=scaffold777:440248:440829:- [translate_table: standard]
MQPKAHYTLHLPLILERDGRLCSCWSHERKHRELKKYGNQSTNSNKTLSWEKGILSDVVLSQHMSMKEWSPKYGVILNTPKAAQQELKDWVLQCVGLSAAVCEVLTSQTATVNHEMIGRGDAVVTSNSIWEVWFHVQVNTLLPATMFRSVVSKWTKLGVNKYLITDNPELVPTVEMLKAVPFQSSGGIATIVP